MVTQLTDTAKIFDVDDRFDSIVKETIGLEGGYTIDHAGPTNFGITQKTYDSYQDERDRPRRDVKTIQKEEVRNIAHQNYFIKPKFDKLTDNIAEVLFDFGFNSGPATATKALQGIVGSSQDGKIGPNTLKAVDKYIEEKGEKDLLQEVVDKRKDFLNNLVEKNPGKYKKYQKGWMNRIQKVKDKFDLSFNPFAIGTGEAQAAGVEGNIDLNNRPIVKNSDGSISTESSMSFNIDGKEVLLPTIIDGQRVSPDEAVANYKKTGKHLGKFDTVEEADDAAEKIHSRMIDTAGIFKEEKRGFFGRRKKEPEPEKPKIRDTAGIFGEEYGEAEDPRDELTFMQRALTTKSAEAVLNVLDKARSKLSEINDSMLRRELSSWKERNPQGWITLYGEKSEGEVFEESKEEIDQAKAKLGAVASGAVEEVTFGLLEGGSEEFPMLYNLGRLGGGVGSLIATGNVLGLLGLSGQAVKYGQAARAVSSLGPRFVPRMIMTGATFGTHTAIKEAVSQSKEGRLDALEAGGKILKDTAFGAGIGIAGGIASVPGATITAAGLGYTSAKLDGADEAEALLNGAMWGIFELVGSQGRSVKLRKEAFNNVRRSLTDYAQAKDSKMPRAGAELAADTFMAKEAQKVGGFKKILESEGNSLRYLEKLNKNIYTKTKGIPPEVKTEAPAFEEQVKLLGKEAVRGEKITPEVKVAVKPKVKVKTEVELVESGKIASVMRKQGVRLTPELLKNFEPEEQRLLKRRGKVGEGIEFNSWADELRANHPILAEKSDIDIARMVIEQEQGLAKDIQQSDGVLEKAYNDYVEKYPEIDQEALLAEVEDEIKLEDLNEEEIASIFESEGVIEEVVAGKEVVEGAGKAELLESVDERLDTIRNKSGGLEQDVINGEPGAREELAALAVEYDELMLRSQEFEDAPKKTIIDVTPKKIKEIGEVTGRDQVDIKPYEMTREEFDKGFAGGIVKRITDTKKATAKEIASLTAEAVEAGILDKSAFQKIDRVQMIEGVEGTEVDAPEALTTITSFAQLQSAAHFAHIDMIKKASEKGEIIPIEILEFYEGWTDGSGSEDQTEWAKNIINKQKEVPSAKKEAKKEVKEKDGVLIEEVTPEGFGPEELLDRPSIHQEMISKYEGKPKRIIDTAIQNLSKQATEESKIKIEALEGLMPTKRGVSGVGAGAQKNVAGKLRQNAENMETQIQAKLNPASALQAPTARRALMAGSMIADGEFLQDIQSVMRNLADAHEDGSIDRELKDITSKTEIEFLLRRDRAPDLSINYHTFDDVFQTIKGKSGSVKIREEMGYVRKKDYGYSLSENQIEAYKKAVKLARKINPKGWYIGNALKDVTDYNRMKNIGIRSQEQYDSVKEKLRNLKRKITPEEIRAKKLKKLEESLIGSKIPGFFPTPKNLIEDMFDNADIQEGMKILEPSAGKGDIADYIKEQGFDVDVIEISPTLQNILDAKGHNVIEADFLEHNDKYDRIIMNPPFEKGQDIDHVMHAYSLLDPGGKLISIMSEGSFSRSDKKATAFKEWFEEVGGVDSKHDAGSFKKAFRSTGASTRVVEIEKPEDKALNKKEKSNILKGERGSINIPFEWEASIPTKTTTGDAFRDHVSYFQDMQLPEDSKIRDLKKQILRTNGLRLSGKISPPDANKRIARLRGDIIRAAVEGGVSIVRLPNGKFKLGMRAKSGIFVPSDFSEYGKYKEFKLIAGGIVDTARMMQEIDGSLTIAGKVSTEAQAGPAERYVGWRTRDMLIQKMNFAEEWGNELSGIFKDVKPKSKLGEEVVRIMNGGEVKGTSPKAVGIHDGIRKWYNKMLDMQNEARAMRGQELIPFRRSYTPQVLADAVVHGTLFNKDKNSVEVQKEAFLPDYIMPNKPFNPHEMARSGDIPYEQMLKDPVELAKRYLNVATKDIFNTSIIQNNKAFISQFEALGYKDTADAIAKWNAEAFAGVKASLDRWARFPKWATWALKKTNAIRNLAVFPFRLAWTTGTQMKSLSFTIGRFGYINTLNGVFQYMNPKNRKQLRDIYSFRVKTAKAGRASAQDNNNLIDGMIDDKRSIVERGNDVGRFVLDEIEKILTGSSIFAGYNEGKSRGLKGDALNQFASDAGAKTQSMYNDEDKPGILRNLLVKSFAPYQTFKFEILNSIRELAGKTGTPPDDRREVIVMLLRFVSAAFLLRLLSDWASKKDMREITNPIPFSQWTVDPVINVALGRKGFPTAALPSITGMAVEFADGIYRSASEKKFDRKLRNTMIKYVPGLFNVGGGMQAANLVDTLVAYSQGGIYDKSGRLMFKVEGDDIARGIYSGVWTTRGGEEYKEKRFVRPKILQDKWAKGIFGKKKIYPTTKKEYEDLPDSMKVGRNQVLLKSETRKRTVIFIDTPAGKKKFDALMNQEKKR